MPLLFSRFFQNSYYSNVWIDKLPSNTILTKQITKCITVDKQLYSRFVTAVEELWSVKNLISQNQPTIFNLALKMVSITKSVKTVTIKE